MWPVIMAVSPEYVDLSMANTEYKEKGTDKFSHIQFYKLYAITNLQTIDTLVLMLSYIHKNTLMYNVQMCYNKV